MNRMDANRQVEKRDEITACYPHSSDSEVEMVWNKSKPASQAATQKAIQAAESASSVSSNAPAGMVKQYVDWATGTFARLFESGATVPGKLVHGPHGLQNGYLG